MINSTNNKQGFTLIEVIVTVSILAVLMTVVITGFGPAREQARDTQRQTDLRTIEVALTLYKNKYGQYPAGCNGFTTDLGDPVWSGQSGAGYACNPASTSYIIGLVPEFLPKLPEDPRLNDADSGYVYTTNEDQSVYKFMALNTVETERVGRDHQFFRCDNSFTFSFASGRPSHEDPGICVRTPVNYSGNYNAAVGISGVCNDSNSFHYETTYAVSAGFSSNDRGNTGSPLRGQEYDTEIVRCG